MRLYVIVPFVLALAACAAPEPAPVTVAMSDPSAQTECHQETSTGSNMIHTVCHKKLTDAERQLVQAGWADELHQLTTHDLKKSD